MRDILFRGKDTDTGKWVYGYVDATMYKDLVVIHSEVSTDEVTPDTVGQYTGLQDKNGNMIFEGDILQTKTKFKGVVMWNKKGNFYINDDKELKEKYCQNLGVMLEYTQFEVIGNIHDNPELLKGGKE